jgi:hypothetical protein
VDSPLERDEIRQGFIEARRRHTGAAAGYGVDHRGPLLAYDRSQTSESGGFHSRVARICACALQRAYAIRVRRNPWDAYAYAYGSV